MTPFFRRSQEPRVVLGTAHHSLWPQKVSLSLPDIARHKHIIGVSGSGKSTFLASYVVQLIQLGIGTSLIDPQGDLAMLVMGILADQGYFKSDVERQLVGHAANR